jgi:hypothetical protein
VDDREDLATSEGFDWLYAEDSAGAVVAEPPAIGAVTEPGLGAPALPDAAQQPLADEPVAGPFDTNPVDSVLADEVPNMLDDFDLGELDASFGPTPDAEVSSEAEELHAAPVAATVPDAVVPVAPEFSTAAPPPPPPAPEATPAEPVVETSPNPDVVAGSVADIYGLEDTTQMAAVAPPTSPARPVEGTSELPAVSSRGDIIAAGARKMSVRERLTPSVRGPRTATSESKTKSEPRRGTKPLVAFLVLALSFAGTVWRMEGLREKVFGNGAPSEAEVSAAFTTLKGYSYSEMPPELEEQMRTITDPMMPEEIEHFELRLLGAPQQQPRGMVMIFSVDPDLATVEQWDTELQNAVPAEVGPVSRIGLGGVDAISATPPNGQGETIVMFADPEGLFFFALGQDAKTAQDVAKQLAKANL